MRNLSSLSTFVEVARRKSFADAAKALNLSTSAASKAVSRLEDQLGVKLLHRTTRSVGLTAEGERLMEGAARITGDIEDLVSEISDSSGPLRGKLTVSATEVFGRRWLNDVAMRFQSENPDIEIELVLDDRKVDLAAGSIDLAIRTGELGEQANLVARHFFDDQFVTVAHPDYLTQHGEPKTIDDLTDHACLVFKNSSTGRVIPWRFTLDGHSVSHVMSGPLTINDGDALAHAASKGKGIIQLPSYIVTNYMNEGCLVPVLEQFWPVPYPYAIVYLDRRLVSRRIRAFIDFLIRSKPQWRVRA